jgi:hypothetical protein
LTFVNITRPASAVCVVSEEKGKKKKFFFLKAGSEGEVTLKVPIRSWLFSLY